MGDRAELLSYLRSCKAADPNFTVLDIGCLADPWTLEVLNATMDLKASPFEKLLHFQANINERSAWREIEEYVAEHGKFSFTVCAHTLEDIAYPLLTLQMLPLISKAGFISTPSYRRELTRGAECRAWRGYIHHRWMFVDRDGKLVLVPKVSFIEQEPFPSDCPGDRTEIQAYWESSIEWAVINDDYLGPNIDAVVQMYRDILV